MKKCPYCKIEVGGNTDKCPLCQSRLNGEAEQAYFPKMEALQFRSFLYKLQLLIVWAVIIVSIGLDFIVPVRLPSYPDLHWSLLLAMWLVAFEFLIMRQFKPGTGSARKVTMMVLITLCLLLVTAYFFNFLDIILDFVVPIVLTGTIIANFVLAMIDKNGNTMAYLLSELLFGVIPSIVQYFVRESMPLAWTICTIVSVIMFIGAVIFRGRSVATEVQRRLNI